MLIRRAAGHSTSVWHYVRCQRFDTPLQSWLILLPHPPMACYSDFEVSYTLPLFFKAPVGGTSGRERSNEYKTRHVTSRWPAVACRPTHATPHVALYTHILQNKLLYTDFNSRYQSNNNCYVIQKWSYMVFCSECVIWDCHQIAMDMI